MFKSKTMQKLPLNLCSIFFYFLPLVGNANIKIDAKQQKHAMNAIIMLQKYIKSMYQHQK